MVKSFPLITFSILTGLLFASPPVKVQPNIEREYSGILWFPHKKAVQRSVENLSREEQLIIQIFLDEHDFAPGVLDGAIGTFSERAVEAYYSSIGHPPSSNYELILKHAFDYKNLPFRLVTIPASAQDYITPNLPTKYSEMAEFKQAHYRTYAEYIAERYHTSMKFLVALNGVKKANSLLPGSIVIVPNVRPFLIEEVPKSAYKEDQFLTSNFAIIDTKLKTMHIYSREAGANSPPIAFFPITPGDQSQIKYGEWEIKNSIPYPTWRYDPLVLKGTGRSDDADTYNVPPGPNNPVGMIWNGLNAKSVGIHGTNTPETIGRSTSSGCIRMSNWDVAKLPTYLSPGCTVIIQ